MIQIQLTGRKYEIDKELKKYINRKLGKLDKYLPRQHKAKGMSVEIFRDPSGKEDNRYRVKAILEVAGPDLVAETATINPHSAIDIVEQKLRLQIKKYKDKNSPRRFRVKEMWDRFRD
ncbi:MAG: putative sigma-54 modulation protein [Patescibacteria group bacterium]|jgi:ribosomal subunit interface protein|nr:putative sigma-54 modulation protein [Patescibacteria group bacterium]